MCEKRAVELSLPLFVRSFDLVVDPGMDFFAPDVAAAVAAELREGVFQAAMVSPPCGTISAARHFHLPEGPGPRPLQFRESPFEPRPHLFPHEKRAMLRGAHLQLAAFEICGLLSSMGGVAGAEHP